MPGKGIAIGAKKKVQRGSTEDGVGAVDIGHGTLPSSPLASAATVKPGPMVGRVSLSPSSLGPPQYVLLL